MANENDKVIARDAVAKNDITGKEGPLNRVVQVVSGDVAVIHGQVVAPNAHGLVMENNTLNTKSDAIVKGYSEHSTVRMENVDGDITVNTREMGKDTGLVIRMLPNGDYGAAAVKYNENGTMETTRLNADPKMVKALYDAAKADLAKTAIHNPNAAFDAIDGLTHQAVKQPDKSRGH
jgi:hypothetical protein